MVRPVEIDRQASEALDTLRSRADQARMSLPSYLVALAQSIAAEQSHRTASDRPPIDDFDRALDELIEGLPDLPVLPEGFSREDIYDDHA
jgi:hypothetical protein